MIKRLPKEDLHELKVSLSNAVATIANEEVTIGTLECLIRLSRNPDAFIDALNTMPDKRMLQMSLSYIAVGVGMLRIAVEDHLILTRSE